MKDLNDSDRWEAAGLFGGIIVMALFQIVIGVLMAPMWLLIVLVGGFLGAFEWKEVPGLFVDMILCRWFWEH